MRSKRVWFCACLLMSGACASAEHEHRSIGAEPVARAIANVVPVVTRPKRPVPRSAGRVRDLGDTPRLGMPVGHVVIGPGRKVPLAIESTRLARLRLAPISVAELGAVTPLVGVHPPGADPLERLSRTLRSRLKNVPVAEDVTEHDVFATTRGELVFGVLDAPGASARVAVFQRGELGTLLKIGSERGLAWVTSTRTGQPVSGAEVVIQHGQHVRHRAVTDREGVAWLPAENRLRRGKDDYEQPLMAVVRSAGHVAVTSERWQTGIEPWQFSLPEVYWDGQDALRGSVVSERGIYRPGERVHLLGVLRKRLGNGKLAPPGGTVKVRVTDPDANEIFNRDVALTRYGTFRSELEIGQTARLGRYAITVSKGAAELRERFEVGAYRAVRFEVTLPSAGRIQPKEGTIELPVSARYLYGAPVPNARLDFTVSGRAQRSFGAWSDGFRFTREGEGDSLVPLAQGEAALDAAGRGRILVPESELSGELAESQALELVVEATVKDNSGDAVSGRSVQTLPRAAALIGLRSDSWVVDHQRGWKVKLTAADLDGKALAGKKVALRLFRKKWVAVAEQGAGAARYSGEWQDEEVSARNATTGAEPVELAFALPAGGEYRLEAGLDGEPARVTESVWAYGGDSYGSWDNDARITLRSDKVSYRPGERARLHADVPYPKALALLTIERKGVLEARTLRVEGSGTPIEVPLGERDAPNVFASLAVMPPGLDAGAPAAGPPLKVGYHELVVSAEQRRLKVEVSPASAQSRPGTNVDVAVRVTDASGRPAQAEVTLWAADEGVLKLTGYATPDPFVAAWERHGHQVRTSGNLLRFVADADDDWSEYGGDSAGPEEAGAAFRSRFLGTAFFSKGVVTDARGRAAVTVPLPDNLTRWRVMAAVADAGDRFGSGQASVEAKKPLMIEPALPRFLTRGDELDLTLMVHNQTGRRGSAEVELAVTGAELRSKPTQSLAVDPGAPTPVRFALRADRLGTVRVRAAATLGKERDAVEVTLPVHTPTAYQSMLVSEGKLDQPRKIEVAVPAGAEPGSAELAVSVAPGVLASITGSIDALIEYPHGCVEQTTSRLIPMVLLEELMRASGDPRLAGAEHRDKMLGAVAHVLKHQNGDGGFGLWPSSESEGFLTAYALWGLLTAKDHGYSVPAGSLRRGLAYLKQHATDGDDMHGQFAPKETRPFAAYVLAAAAEDDGGFRAKLAASPKKLSHFGVGLLGAAFAVRDQVQPPLMLELANARRKAPVGFLIGDGEDEDGAVFGYGRDLRATAAAVRALVLSGKGRDAEDLIAGILGERRKDGTWGTTYNNLWALHALVDYGTLGKPGASTGRVTLSLEQRQLAALDVSAKSRLKSALIAAADLPAAGQRASVGIAGPSGSDLRYTARLRWANTIGSQAPVDRGFGVTRELVDAKTGKPVQTPAQGQLLRVRLTLTTPEARAQVALIDRLPAGFEAVDTALATSATDSAADGSSGDWVWRELHDERVTHFADVLGAGTHRAEYMVRATRSGSFVRPAPSAEAMYDPDVYGHGAIETVTVKR